MSRALDDLDPTFRPLAVEFLARCVEAGLMVLIVDTKRTEAEHADNLRRGVSWTRRSKHLDGLAIDICPYETYALAGADKLRWDPSDPVWLRIGKLGEAAGMVWGGRWKTTPDLGHFEMPAAVAPRSPL